MQLPAVPANLDAGGFFSVNQGVTSSTACLDYMNKCRIDSARACSRGGSRLRTDCLVCPEVVPSFRHSAGVSRSRRASMASYGVSAKWQNVRCYGHCGSSAFISACTATSDLNPTAEVSLRCGEPAFRAQEATSGDLFNDLVGHGKNLRRQIEAERFRGFKIDHEFELGCLQHW